MAGGLRKGGAGVAVRACAALACALALALGGAAGCGRSGAPARGSAPVVHVVRIHKVAFDPAVVSAAPGDTVLWRNEDLVPHTVTARDGRWGSGNLLPDSTWRWVVAGRDSAPYYCTFHTTMHGSVLIRR